MTKKLERIHRHNGACSVRWSCANVGHSKCHPTPTGFLKMFVYCRHYEKNQEDVMG